MKNLIYIIIMVFLASGVHAQIDRSQPKPGPSPKVNIGKPQTFELKNGLKVMVVENHKLPRVSITLSLDNPPFTEGNKKGIDAITGGLIGNGTSKISKEKFQEEIDFMGSSIYFHSSGASANTLSQYFGRTLELMAQGATDPLFTQSDFEAEISRSIDGLKAGEKSVSENAQRVENVLVYGGNHPFGEFVTEEKLKTLTLNDVKKHYNAYFVPNNAYLIIVGDVKFSEVKKLVEQNFKKWKKGNLPKSTYSNPVNIAKTEINFVDMPNAVQSEVAILSSTHLKMTDSDYFAVLVANRIFGGDFNSYLNMNLREAHGWTYGARSSISARKYVGKFKAGASVRNEVTDSAVVESLKELKRIRTEKVDAEMLATVKAGLIGNFVMDAEKPEFIARQALVTQTQSLPANFYENYIQNINAVTIDQVLAAAKKYFSYDNARILVVGKASDILPSLEKLGYKINYFDRFGNPTSKPEQKQAGSDITVQTVLDSYLQAIGGKDKLLAVKSLTTNYTASVQGMELNLKSIATNDGKSLVLVSGMGMELQKSVFDGEKGYNAQQGQKMDLTEEEINAHLYESAFIVPELAYSKKEEIQLGGIENFEGKEAYVLIDGDKRSFYDTKTGLKLGIVTTIENQGQTFTQTVVFNDYKEHNGILLPEKIDMDAGFPMAFTLKNAIFDEGVSDDDFK
ncbi:MAG: pitrilysin family protein [Weeksellaceae bacterium]|jgi:predicted Zn-dependent peptidase|nr:pitrilysin family protein [Weeksellaceae bacterium]